MTTRYVGPGGSDANSGLTWALRKLTLNGVEDTPVVAGDTVYVGPGTYRELLTVDVSGTAGNPITYIGDYSGVNTDGIGGVVRITGSDNDQTATRGSCITATTKTYRTFRGFNLDTTTGNIINAATACSNWVIDQCLFPISGVGFPIVFSGTAAGFAIQNCSFQGSNQGIVFTHTSTVDNAGHTIENCLFNAMQSRTISSTRVGGITVRNCSFIGGVSTGVRVDTALTGGQTVTVNNCVFCSLAVAMQAVNVGEIVENYNSFWSNTTDRTNVNTGANSNTYPPYTDPRWLYELISGKGRMLSSFDLASFSQLVNLAGTSPTTTDMRGTAVIGAQREWGALEYDLDLKLRASRARFLIGIG